MKKGCIVSLHGYCSSHETGFEATLRDAFSKDYDFRCLDLLGHKAGRDMPEICSLGEVIARGVEDIKKNVDRESYLIGTSFGGYCVLEAVRQGVDVKGVVLVKPMVDIGYTFGLDRPELELLRGVLRPEEAVEKYGYGSRDRPFNLDISGLVFSSRKDSEVGCLDFIKGRVFGTGIEYSLLEGRHWDNNKEDLERVVCGVKDFLLVD